MLSFRKIYESLNEPKQYSRGMAAMQETPNFSDPGYPVIGTRMGNTDKTMPMLAMPLQRPDAGDDVIQYPQQNNNVFEELERRAGLFSKEHEAMESDEHEQAEAMMDVEFVKDLISRRPDLIFQALMAQLGSKQ